MESQLLFTQSQWNLVLAGFVVALFALLAAFIYLISSLSELSPKYRQAGTAGAIVTFVAALAYSTLILSWITGFDFNPVDHTYSTSSSALQFRNGLRYVDWAVTVPLLTVEMIGVSVLVGRQARNARFLWIVLSVGMIVTGYLGEEVSGRIAEPGQNLMSYFLWGIISTVLFVPLYVGLLREGFRSGKSLEFLAGQHIRRAALVLSLAWGVYPIAYLVPYFFPDSANGAVVRQLAFSLADIAAKVGYGLLIHAAAKARTAIDTTSGESLHPEPIYLDGERISAPPVEHLPAQTKGGPRPTTG